MNKFTNALRQATTRQRQRSGTNLKELDARLLGSVRSGSSEETRSLLRDGASPDARDEKGQTALMLAAWRGSPNHAAILLEHGANPMLKNGDEIAYSIALADGRKKTADIIIAATQQKFRLEALDIGQRAVLYSRKKYAETSTIMRPQTFGL